MPKYTLQEELEFALDDVFERRGEWTYEEIVRRLLLPVFEKRLSRQKKELVEALPEKRDSVTKTTPQYTKGWNNAIDQAIKTIKKI